MFSNDERRGRCFPLTSSALCLLELSFHFFSQFNPLKICQRLSLHPHPTPLKPSLPSSLSKPARHCIRYDGEIQTCVIYLSFTAVARKRSRSFCQKCRWQLTAKHAYTLRMWLNLHEDTWCMVAWCTQNLRRDGSSFMWHQPCQRCKYTTSVDIQKRAIKS